MRVRPGVAVRLLLGAGAAAAAATASPAAQLFVHPGAGGAVCNQLTPCALATALTQANDGDIIFAAAGTYTGTGGAVAVITESVRLYGGWDGAPTGLPVRNRTTFVSIIDGQEQRRGVVIDGVVTAVVDGFTITRGNATGMTANCTGSAGQAGGCGGGVFINKAAATVSNCIITGNVAVTGGAAPPTLTAYGGGVYARDSNALDLRDNTIADNAASDVSHGAGGGAFVYNCGAGSRVRGNTFRANDGVRTYATGWGGGLNLSWGEVLVEDNDFEGNRSSSVADFYGSGLYAFRGSHTISGNVIVGSTGEHAAYFEHFGGTFDGNHVVANSARDAVHVVYEESADSPVFTNNVIEATHTNGVFAGGAPASPVTLVLKHNTIVGNGSTAGVHAGANSTVLMTNNILANHAVGLEAAGGGVLTPTRTLFWLNGDDGIRGSQPLDGNPNFVNALARDLRVRPGSVAVDNGVDAGLTTDRGGRVRPLGGAPDLGAFEATPSAFDFGTPASPVAAGRVGVSHLSAYDESVGFGWKPASLNSRDRLVGSALTRDFVFSPLATFALDVPDGPYDVTITAGDAAGSHDLMGFLLEETLVDTITTGKNQFVTRSYRADVHDGQLTLALDDLGGVDVNAVINGLAVRPANTWKGDFGTAGSPAAAGFNRVTSATAYGAATGFGWQSGALTSRDRGPGWNDLERDFNVTTGATFAIDLGADEYLVRVLTGDGDRAHDQMYFGFENPAFGFDVSTTAGQFTLSAASVGVTDGQLNLFLADKGGADPNVVINAIDVAPEDRLEFDFGTAASPVASWFTQVTPASAYDPLAGFGWVAGAVDARNRAAGSDLTRDFNFSQDATFAVDLPNRGYEVTLTMGDATTRHELMAVYIEGDLVDTVTSLAGQFQQRTYAVQITDGQLTVRIADAGGGDPNAVINSLLVR